MEEHGITALEVVRLEEWLKAHGFTAEDAFECVKHIATGSNLTQ